MAVVSHWAWTCSAWKGKKLKFALSFSLYNFQPCILFSLGPCIKTKHMCVSLCVDGNAFPGPSSDPAADGASLGHPGAEAGAVWGGAGGGGGNGWRGGRGQLLGLWERTRKQQHLLQLWGGRLFLLEDVSTLLFKGFTQESVQQEKLCALKIHSIKLEL